MVAGYAGVATGVAIAGVGVVNVIKGFSSWTTGGSDGGESSGGKAGRTAKRGVKLTPEAQKSINSLTERLAEHRAKLDAYRATTRMRNRKS